MKQSTTPLQEFTSDSNVSHIVQEIIRCTRSASNISLEMLREIMDNVAHAMRYQCDQSDFVQQCNDRVVQMMIDGMKGGASRIRIRDCRVAPDNRNSDEVLAQWRSRGVPLRNAVRDDTDTLQCSELISMDMEPSSSSSHDFDSYLQSRIMPPHLNQSHSHPQSDLRYRNQNAIAIDRARQSVYRSTMMHRLRNHDVGEVLPNGGEAQSLIRGYARGKIRHPRM